MKSNAKVTYCTAFMWFTGGMLFVLAVMQLTLHRDLALNKKNTTNLLAQKTPQVLRKRIETDAEGFPVGYDPANFGKSFGIINNGNQNVKVSVYAAFNEKVILNVVSDLDVGSKSHYHLPWEKENQLKFEIWLNSDKIADKVSQAQYRLCDSANKNSVTGEKSEALLVPSDSQIGAIYDKYCLNLTFLKPPIATNNFQVPLLRGPQ